MDQEIFFEKYEEMALIIRAKLPQLSVPRKLRAGLPSKGALVLTYLFIHQNRPVTKSELTEMVRRFYPDTPDVQQARHLGKQSGFWIESGTRGDSGLGLAPNEYRLWTLDAVYPGWHNHRVPNDLGFDGIKAAYGNRCATCGSSEGQPNFINPSVKTTLQAGHIDPRKNLDSSNTIPQCGICNRAYRDWFIFDKSGRVRTINPASPKWTQWRDAADSESWDNQA